jgi:hypothetical protein
MAIASRRVIVVRYKWRVLWEWIGYISVDRHTITIYLPVTRYRYSSPRRVIVSYLLEVLGGTVRRSAPVELPRATYILHPRRVFARKGLLKSSIWRKRSSGRELVHLEDFRALPILLRSGYKCHHSHKY